MGCRIISGSYHLAEQKMVTLWLSGSCHSMERSWMEVGRVLGSFILSYTSFNYDFFFSFSCVYDHSLPHSRLATSHTYHSSCHTDLKMKLSDTRPNSIQLLYIG
ncbi:unnamed protein product [Spirodela intermedia]|uniref:Uncharacterized protein n=1 Tax=Spirodela intermedia TaxID=51605 RepID=A0ABN7E9B6_SPIIN|nr:unnamed protein product [Spirodela intermedia]